MNRYCVVLLFLALTGFGCGGTKRETRELAQEPPSATVPEQDTRPVIAAFGNSLTAGSGVLRNMNYPSKLQAKIDASGYRYRVLNAGVSGETSSQGLNRLSTIVALRPEIVIVEFGGNDGLRGIPVDTTERNLEAIVSGLQEAGARVVLAGMQIPPNYGAAYAGSFRNIFPRLAKRYDAALIPFFLEGVGGSQELNQDDGIHPTAEGYDIVVENVWKVLRPILN